MFNFLEFTISTIGFMSLIIAIICYISSNNYRGTQLTDRQADMLFYIATFFLAIGCLLFYWIINSRFCH